MIQRIILAIFLCIIFILVIAPLSLYSQDNSDSNNDNANNQNNDTNNSENNDDDINDDDNDIDIDIENDDAFDTLNNNKKDNNKKDYDFKIGWGFSIMPYISYSSQYITNAAFSGVEPGDQYQGVPVVKRSFLYRQFLSPGISYGLFGEFPIGSYFSLKTGFGYSYNAYGVFENAYHEEAYFFVEQFTVPLLAKLRWWRPKVMPYVMLGMDISYILESAALHPYIDSVTLYTSDFYNPGYRLSLRLGGGVSFDLGVILLDIILDYSLGINKDIVYEYFEPSSGYGLVEVDGEEIYVGEASRHIFSLTLGLRIPFMDRNVYMPPGYDLTPEVPEPKPKISINQKIIEKKSIEENVELVVRINNKVNLKYLQTMRLKVEDEYGNLVWNEPYDIDDTELPFYIYTKSEFRSFETYQAYLEVTFTDYDKAISKKVEFDTGVVFNVDDYGYKRLATTSIEFTEAGELTEKSKEILEKITAFVIEVSEKNTIQSLDIGVEALKDENMSESGIRASKIEGFLMEIGLNKYVESLLVFSDTYSDDNIPNLILFDMKFGAES
jgi:hypothetical protein